MNEEMMKYVEEHVKNINELKNEITKEKDIIKQTEIDIFSYIRFNNCNVFFNEEQKCKIVKYIQDMCNERIEALKIKINIELNSMNVVLNGVYGRK